MSKRGTTAPRVTLVAPRKTLMPHKDDPCLRSLNLRQCNLGSTGAEKLFEAVERNSSVRELVMSWNQIGQMGARSAAAVVGMSPVSQAHGQAVERLDLRDNSLGENNTFFKCLYDELCGQDVTAIKVNDRLQYLNLGNNSITAEGARIFSECLFHGGLGTLEELHLYNNPKLGPGGAKAIAKGLVRCQSLHILGLAICSIEDVGLRALLDSLQRGSKLQVLDVSENGIGDKVAEAAAEAMVGGSVVLKSINLSVNQISKKGIDKLATLCVQLRDAGKSFVVTANGRDGNKSFDLVAKVNAVRVQEGFSDKR